MTIGTVYYICSLETKHCEGIHGALTEKEIGYLCAACGKKLPEELAKVMDEILYERD